MRFLNKSNRGVLAEHAPIVAANSCGPGFVRLLPGVIGLVDVDRYFEVTEVFFDQLFDLLPREPANACCQPQQCYRFKILLFNQATQCVQGVANVGKRGLARFLILAGGRFLGKHVDNAQAVGRRPYPQYPPYSGAPILCWRGRCSRTCRRCGRRPCVFCWGRP